MPRVGITRLTAAFLAAVLLCSSDAVGQGGEDVFVQIPVGGGPIETGGLPAGLDSVDAASCGRCHEDAYEEWLGSRHQNAFRDPIFRHELEGVAESEGCIGCHGPRAERREDGVDCATCHVRDGAVINPTISGHAPHASRVVPELALSLACARCHDFSLAGDRIQTTLQEWINLNGAPTGRSAIRSWTLRRGCLRATAPAQARTGSAVRSSA